MKRVFVDCGVREGDAIAAFLGDRWVGGGAYYECLRQRPNAHKYEFIGFEAPDFRDLSRTRQRFSGLKFELIEKLVWIEDGVVAFDSDGESADNRIFQVSKLDGLPPWRHPSRSARIRQFPCLDLSQFLLTRYRRSDFVVLKLDIEGAEYDVLKRLIESNAIDLIDELYVEYHWWGNSRHRRRIETAIRERKHLYYRNDWP